MSEFCIEGCSFLISLRIDCIKTDRQNMKNKNQVRASTMESFQYSKCNGIRSEQSNYASGTLSVQYSWFIVVLAGSYIVIQELADT